MPTAVNIDPSLKAAADNLLEYDDRNLVQELGILGKTFEKTITGNGDPNIKTTYDAQHLGPLDEIMDLGLRILKRWLKELQAIICGGDKADQEDRDKLQGIFKLKGSDLAAGLAGFLVSGLGAGAAVAAVVAAIIVRRMGGAALDEFCKKSKEWVA
jgi:hypothetical protein